MQEEQTETKTTHPTHDMALYGVVLECKNCSWCVCHHQEELTEPCNGKYLGGGEWQASETVSF